MPRAERKKKAPSKAALAATYRAWQTMLDACRSKNSKGWARYGAAGIKVSQRWQTFETFLADMGARPRAGFHIVRKNDSGHFQKGNCEWSERILARADKNKPSKNLQGRRFGRLKVLAHDTGRHWLCECDCGNKTTARADHLKEGRTKSCGCLKSPAAG